jgi:hypothetical protein
MFAEMPWSSLDEHGHNCFEHKNAQTDKAISHYAAILHEATNKLLPQELRKPSEIAGAEE